ncbi:MAG: hypothetical protein JSV12_00890 [Candidatus Bathyarchaeota archaeon]|nr:MAG: hypothetical protein JSV12_00890 [Candidatus Bathyarchaeota archaeon]
MTLILMALISVMIPIRSGSAQPGPILLDDTVDILLAGDEEFMAATDIDDPQGKVRLALEDVRSRFLDQLGIEIVYHGWVSWDSHDDEFFSFHLLEEARREIGWYSGMIWENNVMDVLAVFTDQEMILMDGWTNQTADAVIVKNRIRSRFAYILQHEISHLYLGGGHCDHGGAFPTCVMNEDELFGGYSIVWQSTCKDGMLANKGRYNRYARFTLHLVVSSDDLMAHEIANVTKAGLAKIGINVVVDIRSEQDIQNDVWGTSWDKTWDDAPEHGWDMVWYESAGTPEGLTWYHLANKTPPNGFNIMCWNNTDADEVLGSGMQASNALDKQADLGRWQESFMHDPPSIIIYYPTGPINDSRGIAFNLHHPFLSNRYGRQAIAHAINYISIFDDILPDTGISEKYGRAPIHPDWQYTYGGETVDLFDNDLKSYEYNITRALMYLDMWWYAKDGTTYAKGPVGDADFNGKVIIDDFYIWIDWFGKRTHQIRYQPGQDVDPDWDNSGFVEMLDFLKWPPRYAFYYPENSHIWQWSRSPVIPLGAEYPFIYVEPASIENTTYEPGTNFTVSIKTDYNGSDITGYEFALYYNPNVLHGVNVTNGNLIVDGTASFIPGTFDNTNGKLTLSGAFFFFASRPAPLTSGPGILANVTFEVVGWGDSGILLGDQTQLVGFTENGWGIDYDIINAWMMSNHIKNSYFTNVHDVTVTSVSYALPYGANATYPSWAINISTTVKNEGDFTETFNVTVYANSTAIETKNITDLAPGENTTLTYTCAVPDPTVWTPYPPYYVVSAEAEAVSWENDTSDNVFVDGSLTVKHPGDVDGDGDVDNTDQQLVMDVFNSEYGDPEYDWRCDFDGDGDVDNNDKAILLDNKGWQA